MILKRVAVVLVGMMILSGCETGTIKSGTVKVYKFDGSISCNQASGISIVTMRDELLRSKVPIISATCGNDGLVRAAVCGIETGHINIFEIDSNAYPKARALGYNQVSKLVDYVEKPCGGR